MTMQHEDLPDSTTKKQQKGLTRHQHWTTREMAIRPDLIGGHSLTLDIEQKGNGHSADYPTLFECQPPNGRKGDGHSAGPS